MISSDRLIRAYLNIREERSRRRAEWLEQDAQLKQQMETIESHMLNQLVDMGERSIRANSGTAYVQTKTNATISDWSTFSNFIVDNDAVDLLERRVKSKEIDNYIEEYNDSPPGLTIFRETKVIVRKPS